MKIAFLGSRGIPARYSGFETFYEQLAVRLAARGHGVTVYNRSHVVREFRGWYRGVRLVTLPTVPTKHLDTIVHTALSSLHALTQRFDVAYYCIVGNSPLVWIPALLGTRTLLNVDGEDAAREKWGRAARWYQRLCERAAPRTADVLIADARGIQRRYRARYAVDTVYVPYGANVVHHTGQQALTQWGLSPRGYLLYVGRFVPENAIDVLIEAFAGTSTDLRLVLVGDAPYADAYKRRLRHLAAADPRIIFTGYVFGPDYQQLSAHAYAYVQPSAVEGTRPALLDQMGFGNCVVVRNTPVNMEVVGEFGAWFEHQDPVASLRHVLTRLIADPQEVARYRRVVRTRIEHWYNWDWITDFHEDLFRRMADGRSTMSYDQFLSETGRDGSG